MDAAVILSRADGEGPPKRALNYSSQYPRYLTPGLRALRSVWRGALHDCEVGAPPMVAIPVYAARGDKLASARYFVAPLEANSRNWASSLREPGCFPRISSASAVRRNKSTESPSLPSP